jgi:MFS family permease
MPPSDVVPPAATAALVAARAHPPAHAYPLFLAGMGSWFLAWGLQQVVVQWLLVERLHESAARVGLAQMALLLPALLLLLVGGALADRVERRRTLILLHVLAAVTAAVLGAAVWAGALSFAVLVVYSLMAGSLNAFVLPTRDALLSDVIRARVGRAVAGLTFVQHGGMLLGSLIGGLTGMAGAPVLLGLQACTLLAGTHALHRLPRDMRPDTGRRPPLRASDLLSGLVEVARSPVMRPIVLLNVSVGLVFVGTYVVLLPLLARELYGGGADRIAGLAGALPLGTIPGTLLIAARGGLAQPGRALLLGQGFAGLCLCALALGLPYPGALAAVVGWGLGGAFAINSSRTLFQEHASEANRGRVLSVYAFAVLGAGPVGALVAGLMADAFGTLATLAIYGVCMTLGLLATFVFGAVHRFR